VQTPGRGGSIVGGIIVGTAVASIVSGNYVRAAVTSIVGGIIVGNAGAQTPRSGDLENAQQLLRRERRR
jgi:hypothetical protein|tara:strand:+ start:221 stop:427 length:207 start_codon:yes stop_codon:yes gene_type:complete